MARLLRCFAAGGEDVTATADGTDDRGMGRVGLDFSPDPHDPQVDGPVEGLRIAGIGQFQQAVAGEHPPGIGGEDLQQAVFRGRQGVFVPFVVPQDLRVLDRAIWCRTARAWGPAPVTWSGQAGR